MASTDPNTTGNKLKDVIMFAVSAVLFVLLIKSLGVLLDKEKLPPKIETPVIEQPITASSASSEPSEVVDRKIIPLLESSYVPPTNPFSTENYELAPKVLVSGSFSGARLRITGEVVGEGARLLLLNLNDRSGIVNGYRSAANRIGIKETANLGGIFTAENPIDVELNLMGTVLGSSRSDFEKTQSPRLSVSLLRKEQWIDVYKVLAVPFDERGTYGGGIIHSLQIEYICQKEKECLIERCDLKSTQCIEARFGKNAMLEWRKRTGI